MSDAVERFHEAMIERVYRGAGRECGYWAGRFLQMVRRDGGVATAKRLLGRAGASRGFELLRAKGRLELSLEALVLEPDFRALFSDQELAEARRRLAGAGLPPAA
jgi:hypothetical protein